MLCDIAETIRGICGCSLFGLLGGLLLSIPLTILKVRRAKQNDKGDQ